MSEDCYPHVNMTFGREDVILNKKSPDKDFQFQQILIEILAVL